MRAMVLRRPKTPLVSMEVPEPIAGEGKVLVRIKACAVCRTDLHVIDGELPSPKLPLIPGHEIVGEVVAPGRGAAKWKIGDRVGIPWLGWTCGQCEFCRSGHENVCGCALFTG